MVNNGAQIKHFESTFLEPLNLTITLSLEDVIESNLLDKSPLLGIRVLFPPTVFPLDSCRNEGCGDWVNGVGFPEEWWEPTVMELKVFVSSGSWSSNSSASGEGAS